MNRKNRREMNREARKLLPKEISIVPTDKWPANAPDGVTRVYVNRDFSILVYDKYTDKYLSGKEIILVRVRNRFETPIHWRTLQDIKNKIFGTSALAWQYFPPEIELIDEANMYWMYVDPSSVNIEL